MTRSRLFITIYVLLIFLSGLLVGVTADRYFTANAVNAARVRPPRPTPEEYRKRYTEDMRARLSLTDDQVEKLQEILDATRDQYQAQTKALDKDQIERINAILNADQQAEYEKMRQERERHRKRRSPRGC